MSVVTATIKSSGAPIDPEFELLYIDISKEYNRIPYAELGYVDGDPAQQKFPMSDGVIFEPGREIEIKLKYEDNAQSEKTVFKGIVMKHGLQMNERGCMFMVELSEKAVKMTNARKSAVFENMKDSDIMKKLLMQSGLAAGTIGATTLQHKKLVQYYATDWDFLLSRAEANGFLVSIREGSVYVQAPQLGGPPKRKFEFGLDEIYDFELEADARHQYPDAANFVWNVKKQQLVSKKAKSFELSQGNLKAARVASAIGNNRHTLVSAVNLEDAEAQAWVDSALFRSRLSMLKGRFKVQGSGNVNVGDLIQLEGMGKRFSGKTLVTGVRHRVDSGGWITDIQFGLSSECFSSSTNITDTKAAGLVPGINGLQIGIVEKFADDPDGESRIKVKVPAMDDGVVWSRLATLDAGKNRGSVFLPEPGDEVILGFLNDDPRQSIILGSVHSSANKPPLKAADKNPEKGIISKTGIKLLIDDEKKTLQISTSDNNSIIINEKDKFIEVKDANKNIVKLSADGILLDSGKDVIIKSKGNVKIEASGNVQIKGSKIDVI